MKRSLIIIVPLALLILINACNPGMLPKYSSEQWTAIAQTQQVMAKPDAERIKNWLNAPPIDNNRFAALEKAYVGKYEVTSVGFTPSYYLEINMNCQCVYMNSNCCSAERMFLITLQRMNAYRDQILASVPPDIQYMDLICAENNRSFAVIYVPWDKVENFLLDPSPDATILSNAAQRWGIP